MKSKLIICIDGFGKDMISKENTSFLYEFAKKNYFSEFKALFAFTGIEYAFFSGKTPDKSGVWLEFSYSNRSIFNSTILRIASFSRTLRDYLAVFMQKQIGRTWFSGLHNIPSDKIKYFDTSTKQGLWKLDYFQNKDLSFYKWPFFVTKKAGKETIKIVFRYESDKERLERILSTKADVYYTQLMGVDKAVHKFGKKSPEAKAAIRKIDFLLRESVNRFLNENPGGDIILWSDHSFADVKNYINVQRILPKRNDYLCFIAGTTLSFWFKTTKAKKAIKETMKKIPRVKILDRKNAEKYKIPLKREYGDIIFYVSKGNYFFPNFYQRTVEERFKSMHGYPEDKELNGFFISNRKIPKKLKFSEAIKYL